MSWTLIESQTLGSSVASVTLGSGGTLPQTYKTLKLVVSIRMTTAAIQSAVKVRPNGATTSQSDRAIIGNGATATSYTDTSIFTYTVGANATASTFANTEITFPNYASTAANKPVSIDSVTENNATTAYQIMSADLWTSTTAITSIDLVQYDGTSNFAAGSTFTLYGLK